MRQSKYRPLWVLPCALVIASLAGCYSGIRESARYQPESKPQSNIGPYTLAILTPEDKRGYRHDGDMKIRLARALPLIPWMTMVRERPEESPQGNLGYPEKFSVPRFLQEGLAAELEHSNMFDKVVQARTSQDVKGASLILKPTLISSKVSTWGSAYLLGLAMTTFCWMNPLPMGGASQELILQLDLLEPGSRKPVWTAEVSERKKGSYHMIYYATKWAKYYGDGSTSSYSITGSEHNGQPLNHLLSAGMQKATPAIYDFLKSRPKSSGR